MGRKPKTIRIINGFGKGTFSQSDIKQIKKKIVSISLKYGTVMTYYATNKFFNDLKKELDAKKEIIRLEKELQNLKKNKR